MDDNKAKALAAALQQIEKQFGKGSIMKMGEAEVEQGLQVVSTGSLGLDVALGVGGLPRGRVVEIDQRQDRLDDDGRQREDQGIVSKLDDHLIVSLPESSTPCAFRRSATSLGM